MYRATISRSYDNTFMNIQSEEEVFEDTNAALVAALEKIRTDFVNQYFFQKHFFKKQIASYLTDIRQLEIF